MRRAIAVSNTSVNFPIINDGAFSPLLSSGGIGSLTCFQTGFDPGQDLAHGRFLITARIRAAAPESESIALVIKDFDNSNITILSKFFSYIY
jgi:hypothetical protein